MFELETTCHRLIRFNQLFPFGVLKVGFFRGRRANCLAIISEAFFVKNQVADYYEIHDYCNMHHCAVDADRVEYYQLDEEEVGHNEESRESPDEEASECGSESPVRSEADEID